jgi:hypothetical protein
MPSDFWRYADIPVRIWVSERIGDFASTKSTGLLTRMASVDIVA